MQGAAPRAELVRETVFGGRVCALPRGPAGRAGDRWCWCTAWARRRRATGRSLIPALAQRYAVYAVDLPGFGHSDKGNHHYSPDNLARVLDAVLAPRIGARSRSSATRWAGRSRSPMPPPIRSAWPAGAGRRRRRAASLGVRRVPRRASPRSAPSAWIRRGSSRWCARSSCAPRAWPLRGDLVLERAGGAPALPARRSERHRRFRPGRARLQRRAARDPRADAHHLGRRRHHRAPAHRAGARRAIPGARLTVIEGAGHAPQVQSPDRFNPLLIDELDGRQFAAQPYALRTEPIAGRARRPLRRQRGAGIHAATTRGSSSSNCPDALISDARIGCLQAAHSTVRIVNSHVRDGVDAKNSRLEFTGGSVGGSLVLDASSVDAAGTTLRARRRRSPRNRGQRAGRAALLGLRRCRVRATRRLRCTTSCASRRVKQLIRVSRRLQCKFGSNPRASC